MIPLPIFSWARALSALRRWALPALVAILVAACVWFASQSRRYSLLADEQRGRADAAEGREIAAEKLRVEADIAAEAAEMRADELTAAVERQRGELAALEKKYGATAVSDLTREHLRRVRAAQR